MSDHAFRDVLAQNGLFRGLLDQSPLMVLVLDKDGACVFSSRSRLVFAGRTFNQDQGIGWTDTIHPDDRVAVHADILDSITRQRPFALVYRTFRADGATRWVSGQGLPWFTADHTYLGSMSIIVDITDQKRFDDGTREEPRQLRRLIENAHDM